MRTFSEQIVPHMASLRRYAVSLCGNRPDADDLLQSTLTRALEKQHLFSSGFSHYPWLSKIMYRQFISEFCRKRKNETVCSPDSVMLDTEAPSSQPFQTELREVDEAMGRLPGSFREILMMICVDELSYEEAALSLRIPVGTVRSRLSRARQKLKDLLDVSGPVPAVPGVLNGQLYA